MRIRNHIIVLIPTILLMSLTVSCTKSSSGSDRLTQDIIAWQKAFPDRPGDCAIIAMKQCYSYSQRGIKSRMCYGKFKGDYHAWCEYYDELTGRWLVDDAAIWYISRGYGREAYKTNGVCDYELIRKIDYWN